MVEVPTPLIGTLQSCLAGEYLKCEFRTTFKAELDRDTLDWYNEGSRLKEIMTEMIVMEQLRNLILDANESCKPLSHPALPRF